MGQSKGSIPWNKGKKGIYSKETLEKISASSKKRIASSETRQKLSMARKGYKHSEATKNKMRQHIPWNKGIKNTDEYKQKMSEACKGYIPTKETIEKLRIASTGKKHTAETKLKISKIHKGKTYTIEQRIAMSKARKGEKCNLWKGGITTKNNKIRSSLDMRIWRQEIFKRDNYTCTICNCSKAFLHADHIKPFAKYPELRFDITNGRTLCRPCHYKITFGKVMPDNSKWGLTFKTVHKVNCI